jgi:hypothetical protein
MASVDSLTMYAPAEGSRDRKGSPLHGLKGGPQWGSLRWSRGGAKEGKEVVGTAVAKAAVTKHQKVAKEPPQLLKKEEAPKFFALR